MSSWRATASRSRHCPPPPTCMTQCYFPPCCAVPWWSAPRSPGSSRCRLSQRREPQALRGRGHPAADPPEGRAARLRAGHRALRRRARERLAARQQTPRSPQRQIDQHHRCAADNSLHFRHRQPAHGLMKTVLKSETDEGLLGVELPEHARPTVARALRVSALWLALWLVPVIAIGLILGGGNVFIDIGAFNSKMAVVTFGGAYAVLAYMAQQAVEHYHWLKAGEMLVGLGFAETTPGPLISVVQFVGFMAAFRHPGALPPATAGVLGGALAMWSTFVPPFVWIFAGGPYVESLIGNRSLNAALSAITAAVVGVILNLAVWFGLHVLFTQVHESNISGATLNLPVWSSL